MVPLRSTALTTVTETASRNARRGVLSLPAAATTTAPRAKTSRIAAFSWPPSSSLADSGAPFDGAPGHPHTRRPTARPGRRAPALRGEASDRGVVGMIASRGFSVPERQELKD